MSNRYGQKMRSILRDTEDSTSVPVSIRWRGKTTQSPRQLVERLIRINDDCDGQSKGGTGENETQEAIPESEGKRSSSRRVQRVDPGRCGALGLQDHPMRVSSEISSLIVYDDPLKQSRLPIGLPPVTSLYARPVMKSLRDTSRT